MKSLTSTWLSATSLILACCLASHGQEKKEADSPGAEQAAELEAWAAYGTPGEPHKHLQKLAGEWKTVTKSYQPGADDPVETVEGTAKFESILGGRFVRQTFKSTHLGMPFNGVGIMGYDNAKKKHVGTWIDSMGTGILTTEGDYDPDTHTATEFGTSSSPQGPMKFKMLTKYADEDNFTFTLYLLPGEDQEVKMMEIEYTRKK